MTVFCESFPSPDKNSFNQSFSELLSYLFRRGFGGRMREKQNHKNDEEKDNHKNNNNNEGKT